MNKIFIVEDDDNIRKLVSYALEREKYEVQSFSESTEFWKEYTVNKPDLVLLDIMLPGEDGLHILSEIRNREKNIPVILLTAKDSEFDKVTGLDMGADDYIVKPFGMMELTARIRNALRRCYEEGTNQEKIIRTGDITIEFSRHTVTVNGKEIPLSFKEYAVLVELAEAGGKIVTRESLYSKVWGGFYGESRTLDVHIRNLRNKLGDEGKRILTVKNIGYRILEEKHE